MTAAEAYALVESGEGIARVAWYVIERGVDPTNVYVLLGGFEVWQTAGYPTE